MPEDAAAPRNPIDTAKELRQFAQTEREALWAEFREQPTGSQLCIDHTAIFDVMLSEMYRIAVERVERKGGIERGEAQLCVAAVGGYGRAALGPWSDIDMVFIPSDESHEFTDAVIREMLLLLNDTLVPGALPQLAHSYRPLSDLGLIDHQTATALLESRRVAGDGSLHIHFMQELMRSIEPVEFLHLNFEERRQIWDNRRESLFAVEPNLKTGPGGLRDFHAAIWVAKVVYHVPDWDVLHELQRRGVITQSERDAVVASLEFNLLCRNWLHLARGLKLDLLHANYQHDMALALGYERSGGDAPEELLMRDYYRNARTIANFSMRLAATARQQRLGFRDGLFVQGWTLHAAHDGIFREDPSRLVRVFRESQRLQIGRSIELDRLITSNVEQLVNEPWIRRPAGAAFREILMSPVDVAGPLREMLRTGVLEQLLPEFAPLMLFLPGDPAHEYSVGEHSLKVLEEIQRLRDQPRGEDERILSEAVHALQEPEVLFLAALFHDVGKLDKSGEHSTTGQPVAEGVARRLGYGDSAVQRMGFLVRQHLEMMRTARLGALGLPGTIAGFVERLPEDDPLDALDMLCLLTYADTRSVGQGVLREADKRLLMELFVKAAKWIQERPLETGPVSLERVERRLSSEEALKDVSSQRLREHLDRMPTWYTVNTPPKLIAKHISYLDRVGDGEDPVVEFYHALRAMHTELTVCTRSRPGGLLRDLAATVTANNLDIYLANLDVCIACDEGGHSGSIATLWIDDFGQPLGQVKRDKLQADIDSVLTGRETVEQVLARRGKTMPAELVVHGIKVSNADSQQHTVVVIQAVDQRGLLYRLASALVDENLDITVAKVTTWRGAAEDAFYVLDSTSGVKVPEEDTSRLSERLVARLTGEHAQGPSSE